MSKFVGVQKDILDSVSKNQLVSAGAGSGKTTIMIEKISNLLLKEKVSIDNLLVVTFTVLAAAEMKERLIEKMHAELEKGEDVEYISSLIEKIKTASIDTIDGFNSKTIRKYFYDLEISPNIEIISDSTKDYYLTRAMKKTIDEFSKQSDKINLMLDLFGAKARNTKQLEESILSTYYNVITLEDYDKFFEFAKQEYLEGSNSEMYVNSYICKKVQHIQKQLRYNYSCESEVVRNVILDNLNRLESVNSALSLKANLVNLDNVKLKEFAKKDLAGFGDLLPLNVEIKNFNKFLEDLKEDGIDKNFDIKNEKTLKILEIFIDLVKNFIKNYNFLKEKNNLIDFNDLNRLMLKLLSNEQIKNELQNKYTHIFVDEYQDVNPLQDGLIGKIVSENTKLFLVGDVKQSIYGFRGASPEWFLNKYNTFQQNESLGSAYNMNVNFRSNPKVLEFINETFSKLMTKDLADIDYKNDCIIEPKRDDILDDKVKLMLVNNTTEKVLASGVYSVKNHKQEDMLDAAKMEALLVVKTITELVGTEFYDAKLKMKRKLTYSDIAILSRSEKDDGATTLIEQLKKVSIPVNTTNKLDVKDSECIKLIMSILKCVVGSADDVDYLATFMSLTDLDLNDFVVFRNKEKSLYENLLENMQDEEIERGFNELEDIRKKSYASTNAELIKYILDNKKLRYFLLRNKEGEKELQILEEFVSKLSSAENNLSLAEFIAVVESNVSNGGDFLSIDNLNSVTLQTIHKSKGLEYPVVILFNASKQFQYITEHDGINFNADFGLGMDFYDVPNRTKCYSVPKYAIKLKNAEKAYKEELRLLYVALTRAKNKLFITGNYNPKLFHDRKVNKTSYMNMLLSCYLDRLKEEGNEFDNCNIEFFENVEELSAESFDNFSSVDTRYVSFVYPNKDKFNIPFKNTVTAINSQKAEELKFSSKDWINREVQYETNEDRAIVGTHYHKALELLDLNKPYEKNTDFEDVDYQKIEKAYTVLSELVAGAKKIKKEAEFMMYVPYNEIVESVASDKVLVQGVVDLIIEKENSVDIVDYKFSKLGAKALKEKYAEQLELYKKAVELAFNKKVEHMYIYSIEKGELY